MKKFSVLKNDVRQKKKKMNVLTSEKAGINNVFKLSLKR